MSKQRRALTWVAGLALLVIGVALRWGQLTAADCLDSDAAVVLLMARHFAHGELTPFFWGQRYMGILEPLILVPGVWAGLDGPLAAGVVALVLVGVQALLVFHVARRL